MSSPRALWCAGAWARARGVQLGLIVLVGAVLRFWGILHGLREGYIYHPDAALVVREAWDQYLGAPWVPTRFGPVYNLLLILTMRTVDAASRFIGYPVEWSFELIASTASLLGATLGTATIPVVYLLGARAYDQRIGVLAAALFAVCPLHSFQSHYPYRDVPMVFFLTLTLLACVVIVQRPTLVVLGLGGIAAATTAALKPAGLTVAAPLLVASVVGFRRAGRMRVLIAAGVVFGVAGGYGGLGGFVLGYFAEHAAGLFPGVANASRRLIEWVGLPYVLAALAGVGYGIWRGRRSDVVLLAFLLPAFGAAAMYRFLDERFLVFLLPPAAVMVGRVIADGWCASGRLKPVRAALALAVAGLLAGLLGQSTWQGVLLSLPDTRFLAGRWFDAHLPRTTRIAVEGYPPLGVTKWPGTSFLDPKQPFHQEAAKVEVLVTSSRGHQRYLDFPDRFPAQAAFLRTLEREARPIRSFALAPLGFIHPTVQVYLPRSPTVESPPRLALPRPYDATWSAGVSFLDGGPYDRDDRTIRLQAARGYRATLVGRTPTDEIALFVLNGSVRGQVRIRVGWHTVTRTLQPGELRVFQFRPRWFLPMRPAFYAFEVRLLPPPVVGRDVLIQLRSGAREIGEAYARWDRWEAALPFLERAVAASAFDLEAQLLLMTTYQRLGRAADARRTLQQVVARAPAVVERYRRLAGVESSSEEWAREFREVTGLEPALLTFALGQELEAETLPVGSGRILQDPAASGGLSVAFEKPRDRAGVVINGPPMTLFLAQGAYRARFFLRAGEGVVRTRPVAILKVFAETRLLASRRVPARDLADGRQFVEVPVPFVHTDQRVRVAVQVEATGGASFAVDRIRIEPDLREAFRQRALLLAALGGSDLAPAAK